MCLTEKNLHFVYTQEHIGMTNVKLLASQALLVSLYMNIRSKLLKCCANIYFNKQCVALNVFLTINWMCLTEKKNLHFVYDVHKYDRTYTERFTYVQVEFTAGRQGTK